MCVAWKVEKAVHYFVQTDNVTTDSSTDQEKREAATKRLSHMGRGAAL